MAKYVHRVSEVEAEQWDGTEKDAERIVEWIFDNEGWAQFKDEFVPSHILVDTLQERAQVKRNYYVVCHGPDLFEILDAKAFQNAYVSVE